MCAIIKSDKGEREVIIMPQEYKYCMECGERLPRDAKFCVRCGKAAESVSDSGKDEKNEKSAVRAALDDKPLKKSTVAIVLILTAVIAAGAAALTVFGIKAAMGDNAAVSEEALIWE